MNGGACRRWWKMSNLSELAAHVEATTPCTDLNIRVGRALGHPILVSSPYPYPRYTQSLDAALALFDEVLPEWIYTVHWYRPTMALSASVSVARTGGMEGYEGNAPTPSAALVAATLRAKDKEDE